MYSRDADEKASEKVQKSAGADRDVHGCIGSAGYSWCAKIKQGERSWERAKKQVLLIIRLPLMLFVKINPC